MHHLEARGVLVSAGSACQAAKGQVSPTYAALGLSPDEARRVLRLSLGAGTTPDEVARALAALAAVAAELDGAHAGRTTP